MRSPAELRRLVDHKNVQAFLRVIRRAESHVSAPSAYRMRFGGGLLDSLERHDGKVVEAPIGGKLVRSSAQGAYQFLSGTWSEAANALNLDDFQPASQDLAAVYLLDRRNCLDDIVAGRFEAAILKCNKEWSGLPGDVYGQGGISMEVAKATYHDWGGSTEPIVVAQPGGEKPVGPWILPAFAALSEIIPKLATAFGKGDEVRERNIAAAAAVVEVAKAAAGAVNEQDLIEKVQADSAIRQKVQAEIESRWYELVEVGGGIEAARRFGIAMMEHDRPIWRNPAFLMSIGLMPLVYLAVLSVLFQWGGDWSDETRSAVVFAILSGVLGSVVGYWLGTSASSQRKTDIIASSPPLPPKAPA